MKLRCQVEVNNRSSASSSGADRRRAQRAILSIARQSVEKNDVYILLQTIQNKQGVKYKVDDNVETVFTRFVNDGKATIRLKEPPHDLIIQCDAIQLKSFLHLFKLAVTKQVNPSVLSIGNLTPKNISLPKTRVVIRTKAEYPVLEGFPRTTEILFLSGLERQSFDRQILKLQSLRILDLSNNQLVGLPDEVGTLPNLTELYLSSNFFGKASLSKWMWMGGQNIGKSLRLLDLSSNELTTLPEHIRKLKCLVTLKLGDNILTALPHGVGKLRCLKYLELQNNGVVVLPGSMLQLRLRFLDVSHNRCMRKHVIVGCTYIDVPKLIEIAGREILGRGMHYDSTVIPWKLVDYLDEAYYCSCGKACFESFVHTLVEYPWSTIADSVKKSNDKDATFNCFFCSLYCHRKYDRSP